jgi:hypothetical protein
MAPGDKRGWIIAGAVTKPNTPPRNEAMPVPSAMPGRMSSAFIAQQPDV